MRDEGTSTTEMANDLQRLDVAYESPRLTPLGNLNRLLANTTGTFCDGTNGPASGSEQSQCL